MLVSHISAVFISQIAPLLAGSKRLKTRPQPQTQDLNSSLITILAFPLDPPLPSWESQYSASNNKKSWTVKQQNLPKINRPKKEKWRTKRHLRPEERRALKEK